LKGAWSPSRATAHHYRAAINTIAAARAVVEAKNPAEAAAKEGDGGTGVGTDFMRLTSVAVQEGNVGEPDLFRSS
jgi:hypothetical protein